MNGDTFYDWFIKILPSLKENAVIIMENASYHSVKKNPFPTMSWTKQNILNWLEKEDEVITQTMVKSYLLEIAQKHKPLHEKYVTDEVVKEHDKVVLRLPPYHCELNPIELAWSWIKNYVRMNNTTFKLNNVHDLLRKAVDNVTSKIWKNFVGHVIKEEDQFWKINFQSDEIFDAEPETGEHLLTVTGDTTSDSNDEDDI